VSFYEQMESAIRRAREGAADAPVAPVPLEAGVATLRLIEAARASAESTEVIEL
jgi:hypothetical protein